MPTLRVKCNIPTGSCVHIFELRRCEIEIRIKKDKTQRRIIATHDLSLNPMTSQLIPMTSLTFIFQMIF